MADDDPTTSPLLASIDARLDALEQGGGGGGIKGSFEFGFDTPGIAAGVDTGIFLPAGSFMPYGFDWLDVLEEITTSDDTNWYVVLGSGPDLGSSIDFGADHLGGNSSAVPYTPANDRNPMAGNPAMVTISLNPVLAQGALVTEDVHLWLAFQNQSGAAPTSGRLIYNLRAI